jgi:hypothetical protein
MVACCGARLGSGIVMVEIDVSDASVVKSN